MNKNINSNIDLTDKKEPQWVLPFEVKKESTNYLYESFLQKNNVPFNVCQIARNIEFTPAFIPAYVFDATANTVKF